ncbi:MAG: YdeI/OmpD-associated family protein [Myxococcaceae bacterium]|nr:YdeI/OmpD-associated family protein [Myxococcaceae bacterium]
MAARKQPSPAALERFQPKDRAAWRAWLERHHLTSPGVWLVLFKQGHGVRLPSEAVCEELLCVGWVDSRPAKLDAARSMLLCTPRKPKAAWSAHNKRRVEKLLAEGRMRPRGLEVVAEAKRLGTWSALDAVEQLELPADLAARLDALPPARAHFDAFPRSVKRQLLEWVQTAKKAQTRQTRVEEIAAKAQKNVRANQWRDGKKT